MTFIHFLNCMALAVVPLFVAFRSSQISEYASPVAVGSGVSGFIMTEMAKLLVIATFVPTGEAGGDDFDAVQALLKGLVACADVGGLLWVLRRLRRAQGYDVFKPMAVGLGWAAAETILGRVVPLWVSARSQEFDWANIQSSIEANIHLLAYIHLAVLVWLWNRRHGVDAATSKSIAAVLFTYPTATVFVKDLAAAAVISPWLGLALQLVLAAGVFAASQVFLRGIEKSD